MIKKLRGCVEGGSVVEERGLALREDEFGGLGWRQNTLLRESTRLPGRFLWMENLENWESSAQRE